MTKAQARAMVKRINAKEGDGVAKLYEGYSGRCMYGEQTFGVELPGWAIPRGCKHRQDNMGLDMIVY